MNHHFAAPPFLILASGLFFGKFVHLAFVKTPSICVWAAPFSSSSSASPDVWIWGSLVPRPWGLGEEQPIDTPVFQQFSIQATSQANSAKAVHFLNTNASTHHYTYIDTYASMIRYTAGASWLWPMCKAKAVDLLKNVFDMEFIPNIYSCMISRKACTCT